MAVRRPVVLGPDGRPQQLQFPTDSLAFQAAGRVTANVTVAATTFTDVTGLGFAVGANEVWTAEFEVDFTSTAGGLKVQLTGPAAPALVALTAVGTTTGVTAFTASRVAALATPTAVFGATAHTGTCRLKVYFANGVTAGTVQLQFNSAVSGTQTVLAGSYLTARRLA